MTDSSSPFDLAREGIAEEELAEGAGHKRDATDATGLRIAGPPWPSSDALCELVAEKHGGTTILSFSAGKDAIATWLQLRRFFPRVVPVYLYLIPDLEFVEAGIRYYEDFFQTPVVRLPHPAIYRWLNNLVFQPPERLRVIDHAELSQYDYDDLFQIVREDHDLPEHTLAALGVRMADSPERRTAMLRHGPVTFSRRLWYPIYDHTAEQMRSYMRASGVRLTQDYAAFGRSFDGLDIRFLSVIRDRWPRDYERIVQWFPLAPGAFAREAFNAAYLRRTRAA